MDLVKSSLVVNANPTASALTSVVVATVEAMEDAAGLVARMLHIHPLVHSANARSCALSAKHTAMVPTSADAAIVGALVGAAGPAVMMPARPLLAQSAPWALLRCRRGD